MPYALSPDLEKLVNEKMASGRYADKEEIIRTALKLLGEREDTLAAIQEGYEDAREGRSRPFEDADRAFKERHGIEEP